MLYFPGSRSHVAWEKGSFGFLIACRGDLEQEVMSLEPRLTCSAEGSDVTVRHYWCGWQPACGL